MVSELATSLSADGMIDPAMDPVDRAILACKQMLAMLSARVVQHEDSRVDQELADGSDSATSTPDGAVPAKGSTLGFSPNVGGAEVGFTSMQPDDSSVYQELAYDLDNATSSPDTVVPAKCSTVGLVPDIGAVEAVDSSQRSVIVSTVDPRLVGAPPSTTMQQFGILKPDKHTPTTCSTVVLNMSSEAMLVERDTKTVQVGLVCAHVAAATLPATTPPHPPDQLGLLLDRPPPWPLWMSSCTLSTAHRCAWLLPMLSVSLVPSSTTVAPSSTPTPATAVPSVRSWMMSPPRMESKHEYHEYHNLPWLLLLSACGQAKCLGGMKGSCTASIALPHTRRPPAYSWVLDGTVVIITNCCDHPSALPEYNISSGRSTCIVKDGPLSALLQIIDKLLKLPWLPEVNGLMVAEIFTKSFMCPSILHSHLSVVTTVAQEGVFFCWHQYSACDQVQSIVCFSITLPWDPGVCSELSTEELRSGFAEQQNCGEILFTLVHMHHVLVEKWIRGPSAAGCSGLCPDAAEQWTKLQEVQPIGVQSAMLLHVTLLQQKLGVRFETRMTSPMSFSFGSMGVTATCLTSEKLASWRCAEFFSPHSVLPVLIRAAHSITDSMLPDLSAAGDCIGNLVMLSITLPWGPGVCYQLSREVLRTDLVTQETSGEHILCQEKNGGDYKHILCHNCALIHQVCPQLPQHDDQVGYVDSVSVTWPWDPVSVRCAEQGTKIQNVQQIDVQAALFPHMNTPWQQKHGGWIFLRRTLSTAEQLLHGRSDMVGCMFSSPITTLWDPDAQLGQTSPDGTLFQPALAFLASRQLTVLWLWDPGGLTTLGLGTSRNSRRGDCHGLYLQDGPCGGVGLLRGPSQ